MKTMTKTRLLAVCLAMAGVSGCARQVEEAPPPEAPTLDLTSGGVRHRRQDVIAGNSSSRPPI